MRPSIHIGRIALAAALALGGGGRAVAGDLEIAPVLVELSRGESNAILALKNVGAEPSRYQLAAFAWQQTPEGEMRLEPTREVVVFPGLVQLAPGEQRNIRIGAATPFGAVEKSYRVFVEELPPPEKPLEKSGVRMLQRIGIPIFLAPDRSVHALAVNGLVAAAGKARFAIVNRGTVHERPVSVRLAASDAAGKAAFRVSADAWYVLAGGERRYVLELPQDGCARVRALEVEVELPPPGKALVERVAAPEGVCGP